MSIANDIKADIAKGEGDLRKANAELMGALGVNTNDEHAVFHAVLMYLLKVAESAIVAEIPAAANVEDGTI